MESLIKRLEELKGPDREVDAAIFNASGIDPDGFVAFQLPLHRRDRYSDGWRIGRNENVPFTEALPRFTASLDAAITLVPDGWSYILTEDKTPDTDGICEAKLSGSMWSDEKKSKARAKTLPIALCIAALKARQGGKGE